uniref:Immunoglobulin C1-set domain-containing protein n=1 Tax=Ornithorhynchus anatinus TaxID=9258 RepID=A0A6I8NBA9_ORNAN
MVPGMWSHQLGPSRDTTPQLNDPIQFYPTSLERKQQNTETYVCLFKDFFPDVIRMHWKEEGSDKILESQQSDPLPVNGKYWQMSWLTVKKSPPGKIYRLIYKHEKTGPAGKEELFPAPAPEPIASTEASITVKTHRSTVAPTAEEDCTNVRDHLPGVKQDLQFVNTTAFYTYTILLLKSTLYCVFMLFFTYKRATSSGKGRGSAR